MTHDGRAPRLRPIDVQAAVYQGREVLVLRDPLGISDQTAVLPQALAPLLVLCDGTRELGALRASLAVRYGLVLSEEIIRQVVDTLDQALMLENERYHQAKAAQVQAFRAAPQRAPVLAPHVYPEDPAALAALLDGWLDDVPPEQEAPALRGLVCPHIDYARGGPVYARTWRRAAKAAREADLVILLGTDHYGGLGRITLTRQHYATPYGALPTALKWVDRVAEALGPDAAYDEELHHRSEHAIELAAVWLHHLRGGEPCELVPILCGSFAHFVAGQAAPSADVGIARLVDALQGALVGSKTLVVAAADLAHVGPAFGGSPLGMAERAALREADGRTLSRVCAGDAEGFFQELAAVDDCHHVCGLPPIYLAMRLLAADGVPPAGDLVAYELTPADTQDTSAVTICGVVWR